VYRPFQFHERSPDFIAAHNETLFRHDAVIRVYDAAGKLIEVHRHKGNFVEPRLIAARPCTPLAVSPPQRVCGRLTG